MKTSHQQSIILNAVANVAAVVAHQVIFVLDLASDAAFERANEGRYGKSTKNSVISLSDVRIV